MWQVVGILIFSQVAGTIDAPMDCMQKVAALERYDYFPPLRVGTQQVFSANMGGGPQAVYSYHSDIEAGTKVAGVEIRRLSDGEIKKGLLKFAGNKLQSYDPEERAWTSGIVFPPKDGEIFEEFFMENGQMRRRTYTWTLAPQWKIHDKIFKDVAIAHFEDGGSQVYAKGIGLVGINRGKQGDGVHLTDFRKGGESIMLGDFPSESERHRLQGNRSSPKKPTAPQVLPPSDSLAVNISPADLYPLKVGSVFVYREMGSNDLVYQDSVESITHFRGKRAARILRRSGQGHREEIYVALEGDQALIFESYQKDWKIMDARPRPGKEVVVKTSDRSIPLTDDQDQEILNETDGSPLILRLPGVSAPFVWKTWKEFRTPSMYVKDAYVLQSKDSDFCYVYAPKYGLIYMKSISGVYHPYYLAEIRPGKGESLQTGVSPKALKAKP